MENEASRLAHERECKRLRRREIISWVVTAIGFLMVMLSAALMAGVWPLPQ